VARQRTPDSRPGVARAALAGVAILLFGPIVAPFTTYDFGYAETQSLRASQSFTSKDATQNSIAKDSWSLTSGFFVDGSSSVKQSQQFARAEVLANGWDEGEFGCLVDLWDRESKWNHRAANPSSGAYGIPQALPGNKMRSAGKDWRSNPETQILWGLSYIEDRYSSPCKAWEHSEEVGWY
jgi:hypothetical protein